MEQWVRLRQLPAPVDSPAKSQCCTLWRDALPLSSSQLTKLVSPVLGSRRLELCADLNRVDHSLVAKLLLPRTERHVEALAAVSEEVKPSRHPCGDSKP